MTIITTTSRKNFFSWVLYTFSSTALFVLPVNLLLSLFRATDDTPIILIISVFVSGLGLLSLRMLLWFINGSEEVRINNNHLVFTKTGTFWLKKERRFALTDIKNIVLSLNLYEKNSPWDLVGKFSRQSYIFCIQNTGRIKVILTNDKSYRFLDNLDIDEAREIIEKLKVSANIRKKSSSEHANLKSIPLHLTGSSSGETERL